MKSTQRGFAHLLPIILIVLIILAVAATLYIRYVVDKQLTVSNPTISTLRIDSDPGGLGMQGVPDCDSAKLHKATPYTCTKIDADFDTTITASTTVAVGGQSYTFKTWDGCSTSSAEKQVCKIKVNRGENKTIKAKYELTKAGQGPRGGTGSNPAPYKSPTSSCESTDPDNDGFVVCTITIFDASTNFSLTLYHEGRYGGIFPNLVISCNTEADCNTISTPYNIVWGAKRPAQMRIKVPVEGTFATGDSETKVKFSKWQTQDDPANNKSYHTSVYYQSVSN